MDGYMIFTYFLLKYVFEIYGSICITWSVNSDQFILTCKSDKIESSVTIFNPSGYEIAYCLLPYPNSMCSHPKTNNVTQDLSSGETVFAVKRPQNVNLLNGLWRCVHGFEGISIDVKMPTDLGFKVSPKITLSGPKYVHRQQTISLLCTSNTESTVSAVYFHVNNQFYTKISKNESGCFSSLEASDCQSHMCQCFPDGRSFTLQYFSDLDTGDLAFRCSMDFKMFGSLSDCLFVSVVDITGPFILFDREFPLSAGSFVEITCRTISTSYLLQINMQCLDRIVQTSKRENNTYVAKFSKMVTSLDNGAKCSCKASGVITRSSSIKVLVNRAPNLDINDKLFCNNTDSVIISCTISGEISEYGFSPFEHRFHGTFIRSEAGNVTGNISFLSIDSCNYEDNGEYICEAWNQDSQQILRQKSSTSVTVNGPPVEIEKIITMDTIVTLSVKFLSVKRPYNPRWFYKKMLLPNSTQFLQKMSKEILVIRMYGKILTHNGYIANLTISNDYAIFKCYLLIDNEYGTTKMELEFNNHDKGSNVFNLRLFSWLSLGTILLLITVILSTALICRHRRNSQVLAASRAIYLAAPENINNVNIYDLTSPYEEIGDDYLVPNVSTNTETSVKSDETEENPEDVGHYLELE